MRYVEFDSTGESQNLCRTKTTVDIDLKFRRDTFETYINRPMQKTQNPKIFFRTDIYKIFKICDHSLPIQLLIDFTAHTMLYRPLYITLGFNVSEYTA